MLMLSKTILSQQGIFDPYTFTENSCNGNFQWTGWFDTNDPNLSQSDYEITSHIQNIFPSFMCPTPIAIEVFRKLKKKFFIFLFKSQTLSGISPASTGDLFRITVHNGFLCLNQQINSFKNKICADYKVRYCCPITNG